MAYNDKDDRSMYIQKFKVLLSIIVLALIGFFFMVSSLLAFHTYLASRNLTTCKNMLSNVYRGIFVMDENIIHEGVA
jgi:hypothetical protein